MVISPPFLPQRLLIRSAKPGEPGKFEMVEESDEAWLERAMQQPNAKAMNVEGLLGSFPISGDFQWHNGIHIVAPFEGSRPLPVRAIADGKVVYLREPAKPSADPGHPQNYTCDPRRHEWSDNGCLILEHTTDIGAHAGSLTRITYYSLYMHLSAIGAAVKPGEQVWRKDVIGQPGQSYGPQKMIHFEICLDKKNLQYLLGREALNYQEPYLPPVPKQNGRLDCLFGAIWIYLPANTPWSHTRPLRDLQPVPGTESGLGKAQWVSLRYDKGQAWLQSYDLLGNPAGDPVLEKDGEYELYNSALARHKDVARNYPQGGSPSGWYELLRFGRNIGPDPLHPQAAHWRQIHGPTGIVWADLNTPGSHKFSDADFLGITGWNLFDDDKDYQDQRCQSAHLERLIRDPDPKNPRREDKDHLANQLGLESVRKKLRRAICHFPTEWDRASVEKRHEWFCKAANLSKDEWNVFAEHAKAMTMNDLPEAYRNATWRFQPAEFISTMKKCGWLSLEETARCFQNPNVTMSEMKSRLENSAESPPRTWVRPSGIHRELQRMLRKFGISALTARQAHFFGQISAETGWLETVVEYGPDPYFSKYAKNTEMGKMLGNTQIGDDILFKGRGLIQLTGRDNYSRYGEFKGDNFLSPDTAKLLAMDAALACGTAGYYWISKQRLTKVDGKFKKLGLLSINYWADRGVAETHAREVTKCINAGQLHFSEKRWPAFMQALYFLGDAAVAPVEYRPFKS